MSREVTKSRTFTPYTSVIAFIEEALERKGVDVATVGLPGVDYGDYRVTRQKDGRFLAEIF